MQELTTDGDNEVVAVCFSDEPNQVNSIRKSILRSLPFNLTQRRIYGSLQRFNQNYVHLQHLVILTLGYTVPFTLALAGIYRNDKLKIESTRTKHNPVRTNKSQTTLKQGMLLAISGPH